MESIKCDIHQFIRLRHVAHRTKLEMWIVSQYSYPSLLCNMPLSSHVLSCHLELPSNSATPPSSLKILGPWRH